MQMFLASYMRKKSGKDEIKVMSINDSSTRAYAEIKKSYLGLIGRPVNMDMSLTTGKGQVERT